MLRRSGALYIAQSTWLSRVAKTCFDWLMAVRIHCAEGVIRFEKMARKSEPIEILPFQICVPVKYFDHFSSHVYSLCIHNTLSLVLLFISCFFPPIILKM